jgi:hypothetical protein
VVSLVLMENEEVGIDVLELTGQGRMAEYQVVKSQGQRLDVRQKSSGCEFGVASQGLGLLVLG